MIHLKFKDTIRADVVNKITYQKINYYNNKQLQQIKTKKHIIIIIIEKVRCKFKRISWRRRTKFKDSSVVYRLWQKSIKVASFQQNCKSSILKLQFNNVIKVQMVVINTAELERNNLLIKFKFNSKQLIIQKAVAPRNYELSILHNKAISFRAAVSYNQFPYYQISKYLSNCLLKMKKYWKN